MHSPLDTGGRRRPEAGAPTLGGNGITDEALIGTLLHVGMTRHEAQMLHALLRYGPAPAREAIARSRLDRATGYRILGRLRARSIISATQTRPQTFMAVEPSKLTERLITLLRDELELHRIYREYLSRAYHAFATAPGGTGNGNPSRHHRFLPGNESIVPFIVEAIDRARSGLDILARPQAMRPAHRRLVLDAVTKALRRGVPVRMVLDCHPPDITFVVEAVRRSQGNHANLSVRFFAPQTARLYLVDQRLAIRTLNLPGGSTRIPELGLASEESEFVHNQSARFQACWREGVPLENALVTPNRAVLSPPRVSKDLKDWLSRGPLSGHGLYATEARPLLKT